MESNSYVERKPPEIPFTGHPQGVSLHFIYETSTPYLLRAIKRVKPKVRPASARSISISSGAEGKPASKHTSSHLSQCFHPFGMESAWSTSTSPARLSKMAAILTLSPVFDN